MPSLQSINIFEWIIAGAGPRRNVAAASAKNARFSVGEAEKPDKYASKPQAGGVAVVDPYSDEIQKAAAASRGEPLLHVEEVSKTHDGKKQLFSNVSFTLHRGDRLAVVGPNGSGKQLTGAAVLSCWRCSLIAVD